MRYETDYDTEHPGLDPYWEGHWDESDEDHEGDYVREDFGWFGEAGLWD